jgi:hypothetical protein
MEVDPATLEQQLKKCQEDLAAKEAKVVKLKNLLTRSMRADKRREQQIESLQIDLDDRDRHIQSLNQELEEKAAFTARQTARIEQLELELTEMSNRLQSGAGSDAAQRRTERVNQLLERSNGLYAELHTRYQQVCADLEAERRRQAAPGRPERAVIVSDDEAIILCDNSTFRKCLAAQVPKGVATQDCRLKATRAREPAGVGESLLKVYLKGVLLEFFIGDSSTQNGLIPVILQLLECTPEQITAAQRGFAEGRQIIAKAAAALGL